MSTNRVGHHDRVACRGPLGLRWTCPGMVPMKEVEGGSACLAGGRAFGLKCRCPSTAEQLSGSIEDGGTPWSRLWAAPRRSTPSGGPGFGSTGAGRSDSAPSGASRMRTGSTGPDIRTSPRNWTADHTGAAELNLSSGRIGDDANGWWARQVVYERTMLASAGIGVLRQLAAGASALCSWCFCIELPGGQERGNDNSGVDKPKGASGSGSAETPNRCNGLTSGVKP